MKAIIIGGYGFLGRNLARFLASKGYEVVVTSRIHRAVGADGIRGIRWSEGYNEELQLELMGAPTVLINLAGEDISAARWTESRKKKITDSRIGTTKALLEVVAPNPPEVFIQGSAIGIYGTSDVESFDENSAVGTGFLAELTHRWESVFNSTELRKTRKIIVRTGVVLGHDGGMLKKLIPVFRSGVGGKLGSGKQFLSWIHINDWISAIYFLVENCQSVGIYNLTAPNPVTNADFTKALAKHVKRPACFMVPGIVLKTIFGQMANEMLLRGQKVLPSRLINEGFLFSNKTISEALKPM